MIILYVTYAGNADTPFNLDHWISVHLPLVREAWGKFGLESIAGFLPSGDGGGLIAIAPCVFRDENAMKTALADPATAKIMADVKNVTDVTPILSRALPL